MVQQVSTEGRQNDLNVSEKRYIQAMKPFFTEEDIKELASGFEEILRSGRLTLGKFTKQFEDEFAEYIGVKCAVATNSGTSSLEAVYRAIGVEGNEVITPTNTHIATSNAVLFAGGSPILTDIESDSLCMSLHDVKDKIGPETKAVVVVHIAGLIHPRIEELRDLCSSRGLPLIEDAAHAHGASKKGRKAGAFGDAASFSFYPAKVITTVEGGMITTNNEELAKVTRELRNHGSDSSGLQVRLGYNWRMSEIHSLIGLIQLRRIDEIVRRKNSIAEIYRKHLKGEMGLREFILPPDTVHSYYKFPLMLQSKNEAERVKSILKKEYGIETGSIYYPPCHMQPVYRKLFPELVGKFPIAEDVLARTITLPISASMERDDAEYVVDSLERALRMPA